MRETLASWIAALLPQRCVDHVLSRIVNDVTERRGTIARIHVEFRDGTMCDWDRGQVRHSTYTFWPWITEGGAR